MERILFGDNQFFGVNHMSEEKARVQQIRFQDTQAIIDVLDIAYDAGIRAFMCTTHDRIEAICDHMRENPDRYTGFHFYPCMPYAHKYANAVTELGFVGALKRAAPKGDMINSIFKGGMAVAKKDTETIERMLIDAEMKMFEGLSTPVIFLQNVVTDLLLGMGMKDALRLFHDHVRETYKADAGFITMNLPLLLDTLDEIGIENPIVCANINKIGFRMCGGMKTYEKVIATRRFRPVAMSVFASGALSPREALQYVCDQPWIDSIVFGASSAENIRQSIALIEELTKRR